MKVKRMLAVLLLLLIGISALTCYLLHPRVEDRLRQREYAGVDLLKKYRENEDMIGWIQVEGTGINYPVMRGRSYLYQDFHGKPDRSGSLFVEHDWSEMDLCSLVYGHNMWMYGTMFNPLHKFKDEAFFREHRTIKFYVIKEEGKTAEKRTFEICFCIQTAVDRWNFASCRYISDPAGLNAFLEECAPKALLGRALQESSSEAIVLSTCSYHVRGGKGRLLLVGQLINKRNQTKLDPISNNSKEDNIGNTAKTN